MGAILRGLSLAVAKLGLPVRITQLVENCENLARHRNHHLFNGGGREIGKRDLLGRVIGVKRMQGAGGDYQDQEDGEKFLHRKSGKNTLAEKGLAVEHGRFVKHTLLVTFNM